MHAVSLRHKRGASVTEFLVAAPVLALLLYAALDLNQMVEFRQGLVVATRNAAFDRVGNSLHDIGSSQSLTGQMAPFTTPDTKENLGALSSAKQESDHGYSASLGYSADRGKDALPVGQRGADSVFESSSEAVGAISATSNTALDGLTKLINLNGAAGVWILPPAKMRTVTTTMAETPGSSALRKSMYMVAKTAENAEDPVIAKTPGMSHMIYVRPETGYHPDGYVVQPLIAFLLGMQSDYAKWGNTGRPSAGTISVQNFNHACMMNFDGGGPQCGDVNEAFLAIRIAGMTIRTVILAAKATPLSPAAFAMDIGLALVRTATEAASQVAFDYVSTRVTNTIQNTAKKALEDVGLPDGFTDTATLFNPGLGPNDIPVFNGWNRLGEFGLAQ